MKKSLIESLVDYDIAMLDALAHTRGAVISSRQPLAAARELASQLLSPPSVAIAVADLPAAELEALAALQANGGWMESPRFTRRFGAVRAMGPGRLARECPWEAPANPAETLWYRALVFRGFRPTAEGVVEVFYVPDDLSALLPPPPATAPASTLVEMDPPPYLCSSAEELVEDIFDALVYIRRRPLQLDAAGEVAGHDLRSLNALCVHPLSDDRLAASAGSNRLAWLLCLCRAAGLTARHGNRLIVSREATRAWLEASPAQRWQDLQVAWRDDDDWNELQHVPTLKLRATGWRNDPRLARRAVLGILAGCRTLAWYRLDDLVATIKAIDPDFQRPDGDYSSWYVYGPDDEPLIGFEHWDAVEGAVIRYLMTNPLFWLGIVDLGGATEQSSPTTFRVSTAGAFLLGHPSPPEVEATGGRFSVREDFSVRVPADASLYDRFQLARFADRIGRDSDGFYYRITPTGVNQVGKQGVNVAQISAFLLRVTGQQVPQRVLDALARWQKAGAARMERAVLLHLDNPELLQHLRRDEQIGPLLGEAVGPASVLVPAPNEQRVRRWLTDHGYL